MSNLWLTFVSPTLLTVSALEILSAFTSFMMFPRLLLVSREKGLWAASALRMVTVSFISLICLALDISLFRSPELNWIHFSSCMMLFVPAHAGIDNNQIRRCCIVKLLPLVKPPPVFRLLIRTCSMTRSIDNPARIDHFFLLGEEPKWRLGRHPGGQFRGRIDCMYSRTHFTYKLWPDAARYGSILVIACGWSLLTIRCALCFYKGAQYVYHF